MAKSKGRVLVRHPTGCPCCHGAWMECWVSPNEPGLLLVKGTKNVFSSFALVDATEKMVKDAVGRGLEIRLTYHGSPRVL